MPRRSKTMESIDPGLVAPAGDAAAPLAAGTHVGGFTVTAVAAAGAPPGPPWTAAEATDADGRAVRLWVSTLPAAVDPALREHVARLARLHAAPKASEQPLAPIAGVGQDGGRLFVARRVLPGPTLEDRLADGPLPADDALRLLSLVAGAVDTLHAFGVPHAHLRPASIVLPRQRAGQAILDDYGFAPPAAASYLDPAVLDVADYLAPEVAHGAPPGMPGDVYALACILVECLTGSPPFPADRPLLVLEAHRTEPPPRLAEATGLPPELDRLLQTALNKRPEHRQQSAAGLMRAAQRAFGRHRQPIPVLRAEAPRTAAAPATAPPPPALRPAASPARTAAKAPAKVRRGRATAAPAARRSAAAPARAARRRRVPAGAAAAAALLAVATAGGFAAGTIRPGASTGATAPPGPAASALADPSAGQRAAAVAAVDRAIERLDADRAQARARLRAARTPHAQALAAQRLARTYRQAGRALPPPAALAAAPPATGLGGTLADVAAAYRRLGMAAGRRDAAGFRAAAQAVTAGEARLDATLRQLAQQA